MTIQLITFAGVRNIQ